MQQVDGAQHSLAEIAQEQRLSVRYLLLIWDALQVQPKRGGPWDELHSQWRALTSPTDAGSDGVTPPTPSQARAACEQMRNFCNWLRTAGCIDPRFYASCASCHNRIDSIGLVFENYGPIGELRSVDLGGHPVDTHGQFPDGSQRASVSDLRDYIREAGEKDFISNLHRKLLSYGLSRSLQLSDEPLLQHLQDALPVWGMEPPQGSQAPQHPKRFAVQFMACGVNQEHWWAKGSGAEMELSKSLQPLDPLKEKLNVISGLFNRTAVGVGIHPGQTGNILSGAALQKGAELRAASSGQQLPTMARPDNGLPEDIREHMRLMCDIVALAFQTDKTRVATLLMCRDISGLFYPFLDVHNAHHSASHHDTGDEYERITQYYVSQFVFGPATTRRSAAELIRRCARSAGYLILYVDLIDSFDRSGTLSKAALPSPAINVRGFSGQLYAEIPCNNE